MKLGYLGPASTFSEEAAILYFAGQDIQLIPFSTIVDVLDAVEDGSAHKGIVPVENTLEGAIDLSVDRLAESVTLFAEGEFVLPVPLNLISHASVCVEGIREMLLTRTATEA